MLGESKYRAAYEHPDCRHWKKTREAETGGISYLLGSQVVIMVKNHLPMQKTRHKRSRFDSWVRKVPWRRIWQLIPAFLPGEAHGQRSLAGPRSSKELDTTEATEHSSTLLFARRIRGLGEGESLKSG